MFRYFPTCLDLSQFYQLAPGELFHRVSDMTSRVPSKRTSHTEDDHIFVGDDDYFVDDDQIFVDDDHFLS